MSRKHKSSFMVASASVRTWTLPELPQAWPNVQKPSRQKSIKIVICIFYASYLRSSPNPQTHKTLISASRFEREIACNIFSLTIFILVSHIKRSFVLGFKNRREICLKFYFAKLPASWTSSREIHWNITGDYNNNNSSSFSGIIKSELTACCHGRTLFV